MNCNIGWNSTAIMMLTIAIVMSSLSDHGWAIDCGRPPPVENTQIEAEIKGEVGLLSRFISSLNFGAELNKSHTEIFSKYPDAECSRSNAFFEYQLCTILNDASSLGAEKKIELLLLARREIWSSGLGDRCNVTRRLSTNSATPQPIARPGRAGWVNDGKGGCYVWTDSYESDYKSLWFGECSNGLASGEGTQKWVDDSGEVTSTYIGGMQDGRREGQGVLKYASGTRVEGPFVNGKLTGYGIFVSKKGDRYEGQFINDEANGNGKATFKGGEIYDGKWKDGCFVKNKNVWIAKLKSHNC